MNRKIKIVFVSVTLCLVMMFSSIGAFAIEDDNVIDTSTVYAVVSDDMELSPYYDDCFYFQDEEAENFLMIMSLSNKIAPNGLKKTEKANIEDCFTQYFVCENDNDFKNSIKTVYSKSENKVINGLTAHYMEGNYSFTDDPDYKYYFYGYIFATKENIVIIGLENDERDTEELNEIIPTLRINGTYFDGEKPTKAHSFSTVTFEDALAESILEADQAYDSEFYDDTYEYEMGDEELFEFFDSFTTIFGIIIIFVSVIPTIVVIVLAIVFGVKYNKNSKRIKEYEKRFGFRGWGVSPNGMQSPYQQNAPMPEKFGVFSGINQTASSDETNGKTNTGNE